MTLSMNALGSAECSSVGAIATRRLGYGAAVLVGAACMSAVVPAGAIAQSFAETEASIAYEMPSEVAQAVPSAVDLIPEAQLVEAQSLASQIANDPAVEVYPVVVDPALAAAMSNGELTNTTESFPLLLTQIEDNTTESRSEFGDKGQTRWFLQAAAATEGDGESFGLFGGGASYFFAKGHSISLALNGMAFDLPDQDPVGINLDLLVRSHWIRGDNWSLYIDGGAGILVSTSRVPNGGSSFNFTPQGGVGASINVNREKDQRLLLGVRWHHISNANTFEANPGLDTYMGYVGMTFPIN